MVYTVYSPLLEATGAAFEELAALALTLSFCPTCMLLLVRLFQVLICATVQPCLSAILPSTSPFFTMYVLAFDGAWALLEEDDLLLEEAAEEDDELPDETPPL